jgi:hypothetical protein
MKVKTVKAIEVGEWDRVVTETYGRPYSFQQQDGCKDRGVHQFTVPSEYAEDFENDTIIEKVNGPEEGVSFKAWLARDPKQPLADDKDSSGSWSIGLWWDRNFYPNFDVVVNDLHARGILEAGDYTIIIDW